MSTNWDHAFIYQASIICQHFARVEIQSEEKKDVVPFRLLDAYDLVGNNNQKITWINLNNGKFSEGQ